MFKPILIIIGLSFLLTSCLLDLSGGSNTLIKTSLNNNHTKKAILFLREAGATVANSYQVSIIDYGEEFDTTGVGNTFTLDSNRSDTLLDSASVNFNWKTNDTLNIVYDKRLRTFIQEKKIGSTTIVYIPR